MSDSGSFFKRYFILTDLLQLHHGPLGDRKNLKLPLSKRRLKEAVVRCIAPRADVNLNMINLYSLRQAAVPKAHRVKCGEILSKPLPSVCPVDENAYCLALFRDRSNRSRSRVHSKKKFFYLCLSAEESDLNSGDMNRLTFT